MLISVVPADFKNNVPCPVLLPAPVGILVVTVPRDTPSWKNSALLPAGLTITVIMQF